MKTKHVTLSCTSGQARIRVPLDRLGLFEGWAISLRGRWDRRPTLPVGDGVATHSVRVWERRFHILEEESLRTARRLLADLDIALALARHDAGSHAEVTAPADPGPLPSGGSQHDRHRWAAAVRAVELAGQRRASETARVEAATRLVVQLTQDRDNVATQLALARAQWGSAFEQRASRYTRSRFRGRRYSVTANPTTPDYRAVPYGLEGRNTPIGDPNATR